MNEFELGYIMYLIYWVMIYWFVVCRVIFFSFIFGIILFGIGVLIVVGYIGVVVLDVFGVCFEVMVMEKVVGVGFVLN